MPSYISAVFESPKEAKAVKKALTEFFRRDLELWNLLGGIIGECSEWYKDLEKANEFVNIRKVPLERLGMGDRMKIKVESSEFGYGYHAVLEYEVYVMERIPEIHVVGKTLQIEKTYITDQGVDKIKKILTDKGGIVFR